MYKNIIMVVILITTFISISSATTINPEYTDGYHVINQTVTDTLYINIPSGNVIDSITFKPVFLAGSPGIYNISCIYQCNDIQYTDNYKSEITTSLFHILCNKYTYNIRHTSNDELSYQKEYETYISKICYFPIKITSYFGSYSNEDETKVAVESEIFGHTGIKRSCDVFDIYNSEAYASSNYTILHDGFTDLDVIITYKLVGVHTKEYYIGQLNPTLKNLYKLGFAWLDKELYILNLFIVTDKLIEIIMFWFSILANSFIPLTFITIVFVIPVCAYYNSKGRKGFTTNLVSYYSVFFTTVLSFVRYVVMMVMRVLEIARSMIPWI